MKPKSAALKPKGKQDLQESSQTDDRDNDELNAGLCSSSGYSGDQPFLRNHERYGEVHDEAFNNHMNKSNKRSGTGKEATGSVPVQSTPNMVSQDLYWVQDEKELKRMKRKVANRESARRSRMRKQAEFDELTERVEMLIKENESLKKEVGRLNDLCQKLSSENQSLLKRLESKPVG